MSPRPSRFVRLARWCNAHRWRTVGVWLLAVILIQAAGAAAGSKIFSAFRLPGTESQRAYDLLADHFPAQKGDSDQLVFQAKTGTLRDAALRQQVEATLKKVEGDEGVSAVVSPYAEGGQLTQDGTIGVATLVYGEGINDIDVDDLVKIEEDAFTGRSDQLRVEHGGPGATVVRFQSSQGSTELVGIAAAAIVLFVTFGSLIAMLLPLVSAIFALIGSIGAIALISHVFDTPDFATQLSVLIGLGVGIDYALFIVTRYRAEVRKGMPLDVAIETAVNTAGRTVMFAAITVVIALLGLLLLGLSFMQGVAIGAATTVLATMVAALTLLPALIGAADVRMNAVTRRRAEAKAAKVAAKPEGVRWAKWSAMVQRRPWLAAGVALIVLLALSAPALGMRLGTADAGVDPPDSTTRAAYDLVAEGFGAGTNGAFLLVVELPEKNDRAAAQQIAAAVRDDEDIAAVVPPSLSPDGVLATITAFPKTGPQAEETTEALDRLRGTVLPAVERQTGATVQVGGFTASNEDFSAAVAGKLTLFVGLVVLFSALLLLVVFRSLFIPVKAAVMNLLSIGAALGFITLIFQEGHGAGLLGVETGPIESFVPVIMFAIVFGLSMDYEVFLISRVHEEWEHTKDASGAVSRGLASTGKVITAAASIMILVFAAFVLSEERFLKLFGIGLASAVLFDALIIRCLLVPALMEIAGRRAWWLPAWMDKRMPRLAIEAPEEDPTPGERTPVGV